MTIFLLSEQSTRFPPLHSPYYHYHHYHYRYLYGYDYYNCLTIIMRYYYKLLFYLVPFYSSDGVGNCARRDRLLKNCEVFHKHKHCSGGNMATCVTFI